MAATKTVSPHFTRFCARLRSLNASGRLAVCCQTIDFIAGRGALTADALHAGLLPKLQADVMLVSDANAAYRRFASEAGLAHE
jgi:hypothetical protein